MSREKTMTLSHCINRLFLRTTYVLQHFYAVSDQSQVNKRKRFVFKLNSAVIALWVRISSLSWAHMGSLFLLIFFRQE